MTCYQLKTQLPASEPGQPPRPLVGSRHAHTPQEAVHLFVTDTNRKNPGCNIGEADVEAAVIQPHNN